MDELIIYAILLVALVCAVSFMLVLGFTVYFVYNRNAASKLYKSKVMRDKQTFMSGLPKPTRPAPPMPKYSKKEPCCDCGRSMSKYFEDNNDLHNP